MTRQPELNGDIYTPFFNFILTPWSPSSVFKLNDQKHTQLLHWF